MNEMQLRVLFNVIPDPECNKLNLDSTKVKEDLKQIINILKIKKAEKQKNPMPFKSIKALEAVLSYN